MPGEDTKQVVKDICDQLTAYKAQTDASVKTLVAAGKAETDTAIVQLKDQLARIDKALTSNTQLLATIGMGVPGLAEEAKKRKNATPLLNITRALYLEKNPSERSAEGSWKGAEFEKEAIDEWKKRTSNFAAEGQAGGVLIPQEIFDIVPLVYAAIPLLDKMPVTKLEGIVGDVHVPKLASGITCYQVGENQEPTLGAVKYSEFIGRPRRSAGLTFQSKTLIFQSSGTAEKVVRDNLVMQLARQIHNMLLNGNGNNYQPKGLLNWASEFTANTTVVGGTSGGRFSIDKASMLAALIEEANEGDDNPANYAYLMRPIVLRGLMSERAEMYSGQTSGKGMPVNPGLTMLSKKYLEELLSTMGTTTQLPKVLTKAGGIGSTGGSLSPVIFGNWKWFYTMFWQDMAIRVSDQAYAGGISAFSQNGMFIIAEQSIDCAVTRGTALTMMKDAETDPSKW